MFKYIMILVVTVFFVGCGGKDTHPYDPSYSVVQFGVLSNGKVDIYEIKPDGTKSLLFTEKTSNGKNFGDVGRFINHFNKLENNKFYLYEVTGGENRDINNDGILDKEATPNQGKIRLVSKGSWLKNSKQTVKITTLSEIQYLMTYNTIKNNYEDIEIKLQKSVKPLLSKDINTDGKINSEDLILYDPIENRDDIGIYVKGNLDFIAKEIYINSNSYVGRYTSPSLISKVKLGSNCNKIILSEESNKIYCEGSYGVTIIDIGDSRQPKIIAEFNKGISDNSTKILVSEKYGFKLMDINNPKEPVEIGKFKINTISNDGKVQYIMSSISDYSEYFRNLKLLDISSFKNPTVISELKLNDARSNIILSKDENKIYLSSQTNGFRIIDVSSPKKPGLLSIYEKDRSKLRDAGDYNNIIRLSKDETKVYHVNSFGLNVIDVSDPKKPIFLSRYELVGTNGGFGLALSHDETKAYISTDTKGIQILDIRNLKDLKRIGNFDEQYGKKIHKFAFEISDDGKIGYVSTYGSLQIIDLTLFK